MGRPKGSQNKPKFDSAHAAHASNGHDADTAARKEVEHRPRTLARIAEIETLMAKYKRGADLLGLTMADVDHLMGEPDDRMGRRLRFSSSNVPVPLPTVALYQRFIPLSEAYIRAESAEDLRDDEVLDDSKVTITPSKASPLVQAAQAGGAGQSGRHVGTGQAAQSEAVGFLLKTLADHGLAGEADIRRVGEIVVMLGYLKMEPREVFEAAMERKNRQAIEAFERASRAARGEG